MSEPNIQDTVEQWICDRCRKYKFEDCCSQAITSGPFTIFTGLCMKCMKETAVDRQS